MPTPSPAPPSHLPILLIGAGITGLTLAQSLTAHNIPFRIFERDPDPSHREHGWGLTIHWALPTFLSLLPKEVAARLPECYVDGEAVRRGEKGRFLFFDVKSGEARWSVPMGEAGRVRVRREGLRGVLGDGVRVEYAKTLTSITTTADSVTTYFDDGTSATGCMLIGCDGSRSSVRQFLCPSTYENRPLPVRFLGVTAVLAAAQASAMRALDPYFLQGGDPETNAYFWFSFLDTPTNNARGTDTYMVQIMISWPYRPGFLQDPLATETPNTATERLAFMKRIANGWAEPFRSVVLDIPESTEPKNIRLEDWVPGTWDNRGGKVILVGDAAHAMVMYRGEAANHGFMDVKVLLDQLLPVLHESDVDAQRDLVAAVDAYEAEMRKRCRPAVLASRQACLDANEYWRINEKSPLVAKRVMSLEDELFHLSKALTKSAVFLIGHLRCHVELTDEETPAPDDNLSNLARFYNTSYQEAYKAFNEEENPAKCHHICRELLVDPQLPLLYRVTTNLLLANLQEPKDAVELIEQALYWLSKMPKQATDPDKCDVTILEGIAKEGLGKVQATLAREEEETQLRVENFMRIAAVDEEDNSSPQTATATTTQSASDSMTASGKDQRPSGRRSTSPIESTPAFTLELSPAAEGLQNLSLTDVNREMLPPFAIADKEADYDSHDDSYKSPSNQRKAR